MHQKVNALMKCVKTKIIRFYLAIASHNNFFLNHKGLLNQDFL
jgi:hypothetical protein